MVVITFIFITLVAKTNFFESEDKTRKHMNLYDRLLFHSRVFHETNNQKIVNL
jgi:hypothetical protein